MFLAIRSAPFPRETIWNHGTADTVNDNDCVKDPRYTQERVRQLIILTFDLLMFS